MIADRIDYLAPLCDALAKQWPDNHTVNLVCHGHSVPSGYFATPFVDTFHAYPHLLHRAVKERFPFAVVNVIVTGVGGEDATQGQRRFEAEALCYRPALVTLDYALNDRRNPPQRAEAAWRFMVEKALGQGVKVILLTPSWDESYHRKDADWEKLLLHTAQIRSLAGEYQIGLADSFDAFQRYVDGGGALQDLLSHVNHPGALGHRLICQELARWFPAR